MLVDKKEVVELLRCPMSGHELKIIDDKLIAEDIKEGNTYDIIEDYPILIDYEKSLLSEEEMSSVSSVIDRHSYSGVVKIARRMVSPAKKATAENVASLIGLISELNDHPRVLIIGGGTIGQGMEPLYEDPTIQLVSFDIYASPYVQFIADGHSIPLPDECFDAVIIQAVLEHVLEPSKVVAEIHRVLKKNGVVYAETPFLQHVHEAAYDFTRFTESGHRYLFRNFSLIKSGASAGAGTQLLWSIDNFFRGLFRSKKLGKVVKVCLFWLQHFDKLIPESYNVDAASGVYFVGRKQELTLDRKEIVGHYKGAQ